MKTKAEARTADLLAIFVCWIAFVVLITILGIGMMGIAGSLVDYIPALLFVASPAVPLLAWLRARKRLHKPVAKPE